MDFDLRLTKQVSHVIISCEVDEIEEALIIINKIFDRFSDVSKEEKEVIEKEEEDNIPIV